MELAARIAAKLFRGWRVAAAAFCFFVFPAGGAVLTLVVLPLLRAWPGSPGRKRDRAQRAIHHSFRAFVGFMKGLQLYRLHGTDLHRLKEGGGRLIIANHPTLIDVVILLSMLPQADCVAKKALWNNPFVGGVLRAAGYVPNDDGVVMTDECARRVREGRVVLLFPEGTRSLADRMQPFQRGAAIIAMRSRCPIVPVVLHCDPPMLMRGQNWNSMPERRPVIRVRVMDPIDPGPVIDGCPGDPIAARRLTSHLEAYYNRHGYGVQLGRRD